MTMMMIVVVVVVVVVTTIITITTTTKALVPCFVNDTDNDIILQCQIISPTKHRVVILRSERKIQHRQLILNDNKHQTTDAQYEVTYRNTRCRATEGKEHNSSHNDDLLR